MLQVATLITSKILYTPFVFASTLGGEIGDGVDKIANGNVTTTATGVAALTDFISQIIKIALPLAVLALLLLMGYGGFLMISSQGNPEKLGEAKEVISNALIGFAVIVCAGAFLIVINNVLNLGITY
jgi:hypothetical protein